jgi:hypothetical protein
VSIIIFELDIMIAYGLVPVLFRYQPYYSRGYNRVNYLLQGTKLVSNVLLLVFVDTLHVEVSDIFHFGYGYPR